MSGSALRQAQDRLTTGGSARQVIAALADVFGVDNAAPMPWRAQAEQK